MKYVLRSVKDLHARDLQGKNVLLRADFNVKIKDGDVRERFKVQAIRETLEYLLSFAGTKVALISHLGRPDGRQEDLSLGQIVDDIEREISIRPEFIEKCVGPLVEEVMHGNDSGSRVFLLENVRFHTAEVENLESFARDMAKPFDLFINDAFSVCHRDQASVTGVAKILPSYAGVRLLKEVEVLTRSKVSPEHPAVAIIGGAKIATKLPTIDLFESIYDSVLIGGVVANEALDRKLGFSDRVVLPIDFRGDRYDIGPETTRMFIDRLRGAKTVLWNGPLGWFEKEEFSCGTYDVVRAIVESGAFSITGGGESIEVLEELDVLKDFSFVSTGGGAMLAFLSGNEMPGLEVLEQE